VNKGGGGREGWMGGELHGCMKGRTGVGGKKEGITGGWWGKKRRHEK